MTEEEMQQSLLEDYNEMLYFCNKVKDLDITEIQITGYDGYAHREECRIYNCDFIREIQSLCESILDKEERLKGEQNEK